PVPSISDSLNVGAPGSDRRGLGQGRGVVSIPFPAPARLRGPKQILKRVPALHDPFAANAQHEDGEGECRNSYPSALPRSGEAGVKTKNEARTPQKSRDPPANQFQHGLSPST